MKTKNLVYILLFLLANNLANAQSNLINDPFFQDPFLVNENTELDKWIHNLNEDAVSGLFEREDHVGFNSTFLHCDIAYNSSSERSNCYLAQRMSGLEAKKYRAEFWVWISTRDIYYTAEITHLNENYTNENGTRVGQVIMQSASSGSSNYHTPGNWQKVSMDIDLSNIEDESRLDVVTLTIYPNCNYTSTISKQCDYYIGEPRFYEISNSHTDYFTDGAFNLWNIEGESPVPAHWTMNLGVGACAKRAPGHLDTDYSFYINTQNDNDGSYLETKPEEVYLPRKEVTLSFYARSSEDGGQMKIKLGSTDIGDATLTSDWQRYEFTYDYSEIPESEEDKVRFDIKTSNIYYIDECWLERTDGLIEENSNTTGNSILVTTDADHGEGSLRQAVANAIDGDSIIIPGEYTIVLDSSITIDKNVIINGQGAIVKVPDPGITSHKLFEIGNYDDTEMTASKVRLANLTLYPGDITDSHSTKSNVANCGPGVTIYNYNTLTAYNLTVDGGKGNYAGGIYMVAYDCMMYLYSCEIRNNQATTSNGGAIAIKGNAIIDGCTFDNNSAYGNGGAITAYSGFQVRNSVFSNNESNGSTGGAIVNYAQTNGLLEISNCLFDGNISNHASTGGGAVAANHNHCSTIIKNSTFAHNSGPSAGAVSLITNSTKTTEGQMILINNTLAGNNSSGSQGGAIYITNLKGISYPFSVLMVNNLIAYNYNSEGIQDVLAENTDYYTIEGSNNIFGTSSGLDACENTIDLSYEPESDLFAQYITEGDKTPVLEESGIIQLSGTSSIAYKAGIGYGVYDPEIIPAIDQLGNIRGEIPCIGASEEIATRNLELENPYMGTLLFPNPANHQVRILDNTQIQYLTIYDLRGKKLYESSEVGALINLDQFTSGMYLVKMRSANHTVVERLIIRK